MAVTEPVYISYLNYIGSGAPADGDQITRDNSTYPLNTVYTDRDTGITYVRKATTKVAASDWQAGASAGDPTIINALPNIYIAQLTQTGTADPVATVYQNTIGNIVWSRYALGNYQGTLAGAFPQGKTLVSPFGGDLGVSVPLYYNNPGDHFYNVAPNGSGDDVINITFYDATGTNVEWSFLAAKIIVKIEVYP